MQIYLIIQWILQIPPEKTDPNFSLDDNDEQVNSKQTNNNQTSTKKNLIWFKFKIRKR